ncbi:hypothetical protein RFM23_13375 [Mesorhizobium abyssinicae]|uniref:Uncharacterized protein n=1 Tax=Mesorhizobium abyssinicae TaxID=1209958 RepID=A0ABU5AMU8_9HYPH|nr:hypothetical protein [Mesorhizobium abyssinicae]MDX8538605.1 hypothetical protein [Mesorhizobium abyssinicae]
MNASIWRMRSQLRLSCAKGSIKVGDEVAITAAVSKRVPEDRVAVLIPSCHQPHSIVE